MGTVGYMSPEQASAKVVDYRSDQFSFGAILYEMATGTRAFQRKTAVQTLAAIIQEEPEPIASLNANVPAPVRWIAERCLAKEARNRYASTDDLACEIRTLQEHLAELSLSGGAGPVRRPGASSIACSPRARACNRVRSLLRGEANERGAGCDFPTPDLPPRRRGRMPDSHRTVRRWFTAPSGRANRSSSSRRSSTPEDPRPLNLPGANIFSISSRGEMAISLDGTLSRVPLAGGGPRQMLENVESADWAPDGSSLAVAHRSGRTLRLEYPIGKVLYETSGTVRYCRVSPEGTWWPFSTSLFSGLNAAPSRS